VGALFSECKEHMSVLIDYELEYAKYLKRH